MSKQDHLQELIEKFLNDKKMTPEEIRQLRAIVHDEQNRALLEQLLTAMYEEEVQEQPATESNSRAAFEEVWNRLQEPAPGNVPVEANVLPIYRRPWWKYAVAAMVVLFCAAGSYFVFRNKTPATTIGEVSNNIPSLKDIPPGSNKAILTLEDGSSIVLDEAKKGTLVQQGHVQVVKSADGEVRYESANMKRETANGKQLSEKVTYNTLATPRGGRYQVTLPDGTRVWLNAASSLRYPTVFKDSAREVTLTGEAYFEVAPLRLRSGRMPFRVISGNMRVEVLGTHFNINAYEDEAVIKTTLLEGKVCVQPASAKASADKSAILKPGQQAVLSHDAQLTVHDTADVSAVIAWKNGIIQFGGHDIYTVMRMIARWYNVEVEYSPNLPVTHFRGEISSSVPVSEVLQLMEMTGEVHFTIKDRKIIVTP